MIVPSLNAPAKVEPVAALQALILPRVLIDAGDVVTS